MIKKFIKHIFAFLCRLLPLQKKVVFANFQGRGFGDDGKYIALQLIKDYPDIKLVWLCRDLATPMPSVIKKVKYGSFMATYELATSSVWVDNVKNSYRIPKRKGQFYIQTWHSTLGFKMNEADSPNLGEKYINAAKADAFVTDLMYSNNDFRIDKYKNRYWYHGNVIKCDVPRCSVIINTPQELKRKIYDHFDIDSSCKIVLYAPTFRKNDDLSVFCFDYEKVLSTLDTTFGGKYVMLLRLHPNFAVLQSKIEYSSRVIPASDYPDMQELLAVSDVLISDYSGCMFDFCIPYKPVFILAKDYDQYIMQDRRLYFRIHELPFSLATNEDDLISHIQSFQCDEYKSACDRFFDKVGLHDEGNGAKIISDIIYNKLKEEKK